MADRVKGRALWFVGPRRVEVREAPLPPPGPGEVLVRSRVSAISAGTELLVYRGQAPTELAADATLPALTGTLAFPLPYGYSAVGNVIALGPGVSEHYNGRLVFAFQPHASHFIAAADDLVLLPETTSPESAVFLPNVETAVNLLLDGNPRVGEQVAVLGQGIVGLLVTALLARFPLATLVSVDAYPLRREASLALGAHVCLDAHASELPAALRERLQADRPHSGADLVYELTGDPASLDMAIAVAGHAGRIVVGSWYGTKRAAPDLGGRFHRERLRIVSSQVSTLPPELAGTWTTARRLDVAKSLLATLPLTNLISHRLPFDRAPDAYRLLDEDPAKALQVLLTYAPEQEGD